MAAGNIVTVTVSLGQSFNGWWFQKSAHIRLSSAIKTVLERRSIILYFTQLKINYNNYVLQASKTHRNESKNIRLAGDLHDKEHKVQCHDHVMSA